MNVGFYNLILKITSQNKLFKVRKINVAVKDKRPWLLFIEQVFDSWVIPFVFDL